MSPRVVLRCYPHFDGEFHAAAAQLQVTIALPAEYPPAEIVAAIQDRLRETYPLATIHVEGIQGDGADEVWHVFRDGSPAMT